MPKRKETSKERRVRMNQAFLTALRVGQAKQGEKNCDTAKFVPTCQDAFYLHLSDPDRVACGELRILLPRYFNDWQLCAALGVEYHGTTPR